MSRGIDVTTLEEIQKDSNTLALLAHFDFSYYNFYGAFVEHHVYLTNTGNNILYGGNTYVGAGNLVTISAVEEGTELRSYDMNFSLTGIAPQYLVPVLKMRYQNNPVELSLATLGSTGVTGTPVTIYRGRMQNATFTLAGGEATVSIETSSRLADWERPNGGRFTHNYQKSYVDSTDRGFEYVNQIREIEILWGNRGGTATRLIEQDY